MLRSGQVEAHLGHLNTLYPTAGVPELIEAKRRGPEKGTLDAAQVQAHRPALTALQERLEQAFEDSAQPDEVRGYDVLDDYVLRARLALGAAEGGPPMTEFWEHRLILRTLSGSRAHGLAREGSDTDTCGVCIPPARYLIGLSAFEQHESDDGDHVTYALAKFVRLALQGNPNLMESLFTDERDVLFINDAGRWLVAARELFLSSQVGERFMGYAHGQLQRLQRHHRWLADPPSAAPDPADYGARERDGRLRFPDNDARKGFDAAQRHGSHYQTWRKERNPARAALEEQHGYDTKHAMHLMRLLQMGIEVLGQGQLLVRRPDAEFLLGVRDGALTYPELIALADERAGQLTALLETTRLPPEPNRAAVEALLIELHREALGAAV